MSYFKHVELRQLNSSEDEFELVIFLDGDFSSEFASELGNESEVKGNFRESVKKLITEKYPAVKITMVRVMVSGMMFSSFPVAGGLLFAQASQANAESIQSAPSTIQYQVQPGDTLWILSQKFNTAMNEIKKANQLTSEVIFTGQELIIPIKQSNGYSNPPATYTVKAGDTLSGIANKFNLSKNFIVINNHLANENIEQGQVLSLKENFVKGDRNQIGAVKLLKDATLFSKNEDGSLQNVKTLPDGGKYRVYSIDYENKLYNVGGNNWVKITSDKQFTRIEEKEELMTAVVASQEQNTTPPETYTVQAGDTITNIANRFHLTNNFIMINNQLTNETIQPGQILQLQENFVKGDRNQIGTVKILHSTELFSKNDDGKLEYGRLLQKNGAYRVYSIDYENMLYNVGGNNWIKITPAIQFTRITVDPSSTNKAPSKASVNDQQTLFVYQVASGDNLFLIAERFGVTIDSLKEANGLNSDVIQIGQVLKIPSGNQSEQTQPIINYIVQSGDTLSEIALKYNLTVNSIMQQNNLENEYIQAGQVLQIQVNTIKGERNEIGTVKLLRSSDVFNKNESGSLEYVKTLPQGGAYRAYSIDYENNLYNVGGNNWVKITPDVQFTRVGEIPSRLTYITHSVVSGDTIWDLSIKYGIPQSELLKINGLTLNSPLSVGQKLKIPQYHIEVKPTVSPKHGEHLDWWTEAQYVIPIGKIFKVIDFETGKSFMVKRTIGANHADCETVTIKDSNIAKSIWNAYSWDERAVIIEVDGRKIAASMSFMPHDVEYIKDNGINGHFDIHFKNSTRHKDGKIDYAHQKEINIAAGVNVK